MELLYFEELKLFTDFDKQMFEWVVARYFTSSEFTTRKLIDFSIQQVLHQVQANWLLFPLRVLASVQKVSIDQTSPTRSPFYY